MSSDIFYFDHAAATPVDKRVLRDMLPFFSDNFFNPSSPYAPALAVRRDYEAAKARLAHTFGAKADEIIITAGATESINLAIGSFDGHIVSSAVEHDAVLGALKGRNCTLVSPKSDGIVHAEAVRDAITEDTELVSVQFANNELGTVQPIKQIAEVVREVRKQRQDSANPKPIYLHCDASQGFGQIDINAARLGVDLLTLNSGKMYGPKQVALLWAKPGVSLNPIIVGGGQERGMRSGTENVAGVVGFAAAAELAKKHQEHEAKRLMKMRDKLQHALQSSFENMTVNGSKKKRLPGSLHVSFPGLDAERLVFGLEARGVMLATGSACAANKGTRSHVLSAVGMTDSEADGSLRMTLGRTNDEESIDQAADIIIEVVRAEYKR